RRVARGRPLRARAAHLRPDRLAGRGGVRESGGEPRPPWSHGDRPPDRVPPGDRDPHVLAAAGLLRLAGRGVRDRGGERRRDARILGPRRGGRAGDDLAVWWSWTRRAAAPAVLVRVLAGFAVPLGLWALYVLRDPAGFAAQLGGSLARKAGRNPWSASFLWHALQDSLGQYRDPSNPT